MNNEDIRLEKVKDSIRGLPAMDTVENTKEALDVLEWVVKELRTVYLIMFLRRRFALQASEKDDDDDDGDPS